MTKHGSWPAAYERIHPEEKESKSPSLERMMRYVPSARFVYYDMGRCLTKSSNIPIHQAEPWQHSFAEAIDKLMQEVESRQNQATVIVELREKLRVLERNVASLACSGSILVPIETFAPEPFVVLKTIPAVVQQVDENEFLAGFFDANIHMAGCNSADAVSNLKDVILDRYELLESKSDENLASGLRKQAAVLREFVKRRD